MFSGLVKIRLEVGTDSSWQRWMNSRYLDVFVKIQVCKLNLWASLRNAFMLIWWLAWSGASTASDLVWSALLISTSPKIYILWTEKHKINNKLHLPNATTDEPLLLVMFLGWLIETKEHNQNQQQWVIQKRIRSKLNMFKTNVMWFNFPIVVSLFICFFKFVWEFELKAGYLIGFLLDLIVCGVIIVSDLFHMLQGCQLIAIPWPFSVKHIHYILWGYNFWVCFFPILNQDVILGRFFYFYFDQV